MNSLTTNCLLFAELTIAFATSSSVKPNGRPKAYSIRCSVIGALRKSRSEVRLGQRASRVRSLRRCDDIRRASCDHQRASNTGRCGKAGRLVASPPGYQKSSSLGIRYNLRCGQQSDSHEMHSANSQRVSQRSHQLAQIHKHCWGIQRKHTHCHRSVTQTRHCVTEACPLVLTAYAWPDAIKRCWTTSTARKVEQQCL